MNMVMERIMNDILPPNHPQRSYTHVHVPVDVLPVVTLQRTLTEAFKRGWLSLKCIHTLEQLLALCGSDWFCEKVVMVSKWSFVRCIGFMSLLWWFVLHRPGLEFMKGLQDIGTTKPIVPIAMGR